MADEKDVLARFEAVLAAKEAELEAAKKKGTPVGTMMKSGGGAAIGGYVGWQAGLAAGAALAPFTGGLSVVVGPVLGAVAAGYVGHKASKDID